MLAILNSTGFRCCYCYAVNPARKQKPRAPPLETGQLHSSDKQQTAFAKCTLLLSVVIELFYLFN